MTQHPTPEQVQTVIDRLKLIESQANQNGAFDINTMDVQTDKHSCGTVHCVAGWYAIANIDHPFIANAMRINYCSYLEGACLMAHHLGFEFDNDLDYYMGNHPEIWGNDNGEGMFSNVIAYNGLETDSQNPMTIIIQHWQQVKKNLENLAQG